MPSSELSLALKMAREHQRPPLALMDLIQEGNLGLVQRKLFFRLRAEQRSMIAAGLEPTPRLLAERLNVPEQDVIQMNQRLQQDELRLDAPALPEGDAPSFQLPALASGLPAADDQLAERELKHRLKSELACFSQELEDPRGRFILEHRLLSETPLTLADMRVAPAPEAA